jgi:hypothetical protein
MKHFSVRRFKRDIVLAAKRLVLRANTLVTIRIHDKVHRIDQNYCSLDQLASMSSVQCVVFAIYILVFRDPFSRGAAALVSPWCSFLWNMDIAYCIVNNSN